MRILSRIKGLFSRHHYREEINRLKAEGDELDARISEIERVATVNGDTDWFIGKLKRDPSCALKVLRECDRDAK